MPNQRESKSLSDAWFSWDDVSLPTTDDVENEKAVWFFVFVAAAFVMFIFFGSLLGTLAAVVGAIMSATRQRVTRGSTRAMYAVVATLLFVPLVHVAYVAGATGIAAIVYVMVMVSLLVVRRK